MTNRDARFWAKVDVFGPDACWPWMSTRNHAGYGRVDFGGRLARAHRVAWILTHGAIPAGLCVLHRCDNPPCCNPRHLWLGDDAANVADMVAKGRARGGSQPGERNGSAKLTAAQVVEIRALRGQMTGQAIAARYGISNQQVSDIQLGRAWAHVQPRQGGYGAPVGTGG